MSSWLKPKKFVSFLLSTGNELMCLIKGRRLFTLLTLKKIETLGLSIMTYVKPTTIYQICQLFHPVFRSGISMGYINQVFLLNDSLVKS